jgi:hypothetical protein
MIFHNNSNFSIQFPRGFIPTEIISKYETYLNNNTFSIFKDVLSFLNHTIKSISIPGITFSPSTQFKNYGREINYRSGQPTQELFEKDITFTFSKTDGLINYFMLLEIFTKYYNFSNNLTLIREPLIVSIIDSNNVTTVILTFTDFIIDNLDSLDLDFSENEQAMDTFSLKCTFNQLQINILGDNIL